MKVIQNYLKNLVQSQSANVGIAKYVIIGEGKGLFT